MLTNKQETKSQFNYRYGKFLKEVRIDDKHQTLEEVANATGVDIDTLQKCENGQSLELYDLVKLWEHYGIESDS